MGGLQPQSPMDSAAYDEGSFVLVRMRTYQQEATWWAWSAMMTNKNTIHY